MSVLAPVAMFGWIPIVLLLFLQLPARRAVIVAFLGAWLFLPMATFPVAGLPDYDKSAAACLSVLLGTFLFEFGRLSSFRPHWLDVPMAVWCLVPIASSMSNGLGAYDGVSVALKTSVNWGLPYFIGRLYFRSADGLKELAVAIFIGGLVYVPFCLYEIKMSPQLHNMFYGYQVAFLNSRRFGGWRPVVFMQDGLMVGAWMMATALTGVWLWGRGQIKELWGWPASWLVLVVVTVAILCKSLGSIVLLLIGVGLLFTGWRLRSVYVLAALAFLPALYPFMRLSGNWSGEVLLSYGALAGQDRADSLATRLRNEDMLGQKALEQPLLGWGGWGRNRVYDEESGRDLSLTDGLWVIAVGTHGLVGLVAVTATQLLGPVGLLLRMRHHFRSAPVLAAPMVLCVLLLLVAIDNIFNAMINPVFLLTLGAVASAFVAMRMSVVPPVRVIDSGAASRRSLATASLYSRPR